MKTMDNYLPTRKLLREAADETYVSDDGSTMRREYGLTPNGNSIGGFWVLRGPKGGWIGVNRYRYDLAEQNGFDIA